MTFDAIVAGAGIWGCTVARRLAEAGRRVLVLEKRAAIGGNCRCEIDSETGIEVHTYGSHIFHTSNEEVWAFVRRFTEFNDYRHCVLARTKARGRGVEVESRRRCAEKKVEEWLAGVDEAAFEAALVKLIDEKNAAGEYVFSNVDERAKAIGWAKRFYLEFSHKLIELSDGRYVYFVPDARARDRGVDNSRAWAEYAFHAVSTGGRRVPGKTYFIRHFSDVKCENISRVETTIRRENCIAAIEEGRPERAAIHFVGISTRGKRFDIVTRLDEFGNAEANLSEVTVVMTKKKCSEKDPPPKFRPLTEAVEAVVKHQAAGFSPSTTGESLANFSDARKRGGEKKIGQESGSTAEGAPSTCFDLTQSHRDAEAPPTPTLNSNSYHTYHLPIGKTLLEEFFGVSMKGKNLREFLAEPVDAGPCPRQKADDDVLLGRGEGAASTGASRTHGDEIFDVFIRGYTSKQWGVAPEKVDPSIIARLKVRDNYSTDYFDDPHQGIPSEGYNKMFERMLDHSNITVVCETELKVQGSRLKVEGKGSAMLPTTLNSEHTALNIYYSGPIDALFNYKFGHLPWRTLNFERETLNCPDYQGNSVVNYTDADVPFTRIHEFKHYHPEKVEVKVKGEGEQRKLASKWGFDAPKTIIMREYSSTWQPGDEPYYPIDNAESRALLAKYLSEVEKLNHHCSTSNLQPSTSLTIGGRLGAYRYYDMDKSVAAALTVPIA